MPFERTPSGDLVITGSASIQLYRLIVLRHRLALEMKGIRFRGSAWKVLKSELGLTGSRAKVLAAVDQLLERHHANPGSQEVQ